jgi:hypothetical protein
MTLQLLPSEYPKVEGKLYFLFYQCSAGAVGEYWCWWLCGYINYTPGVTDAYAGGGDVPRACGIGRCWLC